MMLRSYLSSLILSVDDFGISSKANENILQLVKLGHIDRVSVMFSEDNKSNQEDFLKLAKSKVKIDLHLVIPELAASKEKRKLKEGVFKRGFSFLFQYLAGKLSSQQVEAEWDRQIKQFEKIFGRMPDGLNSHQHTHFFPSYFQVIVKLSQKYHIKYLRFGKKGMVAGKNNIVRILKTLWRLDKKNFQQKGLTTSDYLASLDWIENLGKFFQEMPKGTIEIVCHPERDEEFETVQLLTKSNSLKNLKEQLTTANKR